MTTLENEMALVQALKDKTKTLHDEIKALEKSIKLAHGTEDDVSDEAAQAVALARPLSVRMEEVLRASPLSLDALSKKLGEPAGLVQPALRAAREHVTNIGMPDRPVWFWKVGTDATTKQVYDTISVLINYQPMTFQELKIATGCRDGQVQGALVEIRRSGMGVHNLGSQNRARYFALPTTAIDARLIPKGKKSDAE